jgi:hypothetical protein
MNTIRIEIDEVKKYRNRQEYHTLLRARLGDLEVINPDSVIKPILKLFHEKNPGFNPIVEVYRGDTPCFMPMALNSWLFPPDRRPEQFKR